MTNHEPDAAQIADLFLSPISFFLRVSAYFFAYRIGTNCARAGFEWTVDASAGAGLDGARDAC
jgi:hypothetical protein